MIILYGGSFNPPTIAHYYIAQHLINKYKPNAFIFIPVGNNYHKEDLVDFRYRYKMLKILSEKLKYTYVSDYENNNTVFKGTIDTLNYFQEKYKNEEIYYVIGADNLFSFDKWINYKELLLKYKFLVLNRDNYDVKLIIMQNNNIACYINSFIIEDDIKEIDVSSTQYRDEMKDEVVLSEINNYIYKEKLYKRGGNNER